MFINFNNLEISSSVTLLKGRPEQVPSGDRSTLPNAGSQTEWLWWCEYNDHQTNDARVPFCKEGGTGLVVCARRPSIIALNTPPSWCFRRSKSCCSSCCCCWWCCGPILHVLGSWYQYDETILGSDAVIKIDDGFFWLRKADLRAVLWKYVIFVFENSSFCLLIWYRISAP